MGKTQKNKKTSRKPTKNNIWRLSGKALLTKSKKTRENQNFSENVWSKAHVWFFLFFLGLDLEKTKKLKVFLDKIMVKEL